MLMPHPSATAKAQQKHIQTTRRNSEHEPALLAFDVEGKDELALLSWTRLRAVRLAVAVEVEVLTVVVKIDVLSVVGSFASEDRIAARSTEGKAGNKRKLESKFFVVSASSRVWLLRHTVRTALKAYKAWSTSLVRGKCQCDDGMQLPELDGNNVV